MSRAKPKIYCDTNIYSRPFDDIAHPRIYLEAIACLKIFNLAYDKRIDLLSSDILNYEIEHSSLDKQLLTKPLLQLCKTHIRQTLKIKYLAELLLNEIKLAPRDSLHLASAVTGKANFFLTCDDEIIRKTKNLSMHKIIIINPIDFLYHHYYEN